MRIFIIDDDHLSLFLTESMLLLERTVTEVKCFPSATDALQAIRSESAWVPDIIFLDLNMPVMDGWAFLDTVVSDALLLPNNKCGIYILTSSLDLADMARAKNYSIVTGFMHKPITIEDIKVVMEHAVIQHAWLK